jgi:hypothetical protein
MDPKEIDEASAPAPTRQVTRLKCVGGYPGLSLSARIAQSIPSAYRLAPKLAVASVVYVI